eukprot:TRINITY_DN10204_c0_g1_i10.p1 TRINITY_DN10204_c0_g1~~TRINITY_DN10204_c0_g1_i10.p1  ORF type:complete len:312 (+),score=46.24 TRINITY_DN10204_c0_g1_i10:553-1488(+)
MPTAAGYGLAATGGSPPPAPPLPITGLSSRIFAAIEDVQAAGYGLAATGGSPLPAPPPPTSGLSSRISAAIADVRETRFIPIKFMVAAFSPSKRVSSYLREDALEVMPEFQSHMEELVHVCGQVANDRIRTHSLLTKYVGLDEQMVFAITVYTYDTREGELNFYVLYNRALRTRQFETMRHLQGYSYYFLTGLNTLPTWRGRVFRGIPARELEIVRTNYQPNNYVHWSSFSSASRTRAVAESMAGPGGVIFLLQVVSGKDICEFSAIPSEDEIILSPNTRFFIGSELTQLASGHWELNLAEVPETIQTYVF